MTAREEATMQPTNVDHQDARDHDPSIITFAYILPHSPPGKFPDNLEDRIHENATKAAAKAVCETMEKSGAVADNHTQRTHRRTDATNRSNSFF